MILLVLLHYLIVSWHTGMRDEEAGRRLQDGKLRELIERQPEVFFLLGHLDTGLVEGFEEPSFEEWEFAYRRVTLIHLQHTLVCLEMRDVISWCRAVGNFLPRLFL